MPKCLITGCALLDVDQDRWAWGDLHEVGECYVFNACLEEGEMNWIYAAANSGQKALVVQDGDAYFERRGVLIVAKTAAVLNAAAKEYLA